MDAQLMKQAKRQKAIRKMILRIMPVIQQHGFQQLKMDEAAKIMDISKATMYKYFASKDEIIESVVDHYIEYIMESELMQGEPLRNGGSFVDTFDLVFEQALLMAVYMSDVFLQDLSSGHPSLYNQLLQKVELRNEQVRKFLVRGMKEGVFQHQNPVLLMIQLDTMLRKFLEPKLLMTYHLPLKQALSDYYQGIHHQLLVDKYKAEADGSRMESFLNQMVQKLSR